MYVWLYSIERAGLQSRLDFSAARRLRLSCFARQVNISSWPIAVVWPPVRIATLLPTMWVRNCDACSGVWSGAAMEQMPAIFERLTRDIPRARKALCLAPSCVQLLESGGTCSSLSTSAVSNCVACVDGVFFCPSVHAYVPVSFPPPSVP